MSGFIDDDFDDVDEPDAPAKDRILAAIRNGHRTLGQIKRGAGFDRSTDISDELEDLQLIDGQIKLERHGNISAYFLMHERPKRFWMAGDGTLAVEWAGEPERVGQDEAAKKPPPEKPEEENVGKQKHEYDLEVIEQAARDGLTFGQAADRAGVPFTALYYQLSKEGPVRDAWIRGGGGAKKARSRKATSKPKAKTRPKKEPKPAEERRAADKPAPAQAKGNGASSVKLENGVQALTVTFESGAQVVLGFEGNIFDLRPHEAALVGELGETMREFGR